MTTVLEVTDLAKTYMMGQVPVEALRGVSFTMEGGEYISVTGPSGSGKSTLLNLIGALDRPTRGTLRIRGTDVMTLNDNQLADLRRNVGFVFQFFNMIPRLDAIGNVELPLSVAGVSKGERRRRAVELLEQVGLGDRVHHTPSELSGGERQRVAVARALITSPAFVLMDEPTGNLDSKTASEIMELVRSLNREYEMTMIVVTHDLEVASQAQRRIQLKDGLIISDGVN